MAADRSNRGRTRGDDRVEREPPKPAPAGVTELHRLLIENAIDYAIFVLDVSGHILSWNTGAKRLKGYEAEEIIGKHFSIFYPDSDIRSGKPQRELEIAAATGRVEDEGWRLRKDGTRFWANVVITALRDEHGRLVGFAKITRDLTERRQREEQARTLAAEVAARAAADRRNRELLDLTDQLQQQAGELESQTEEAQSLTEELEQANELLHAALEAAERAERERSYSARATEILNASLDYQTTLNDLAHLVVPELADWCAVDILEDDEEMRQLAIAHIDPEKLRVARELNERFPADPSEAQGVWNVVRTGRPEVYSDITDEMIDASIANEEQRQLLRALGLKSIMIVPLIGRGRVLGALTMATAESRRHFTDADLSFAMDLARRAATAVDNARLHRQALEARAAAERANQAKTQFLAVMSHELRTPLNAIAGYTELLRLGLRGPITAQQEEDLARIDRSQRALLSLINDILNYARLETGHVEYNVEEVRLYEVVADLEALVLPQMQSKGLRFEFHDCSRDLVARADLEKVRQILVNLLANSIKFTPSGGLVAVRCGGDADTVRVEVCDTGSGIPTDQLRTIFEPFVQLDRKFTSAQEGSGLGLAISRDLAWGMHGDLTVRSTLGTGSTFLLTLPRANYSGSSSASAGSSQ